MLERTRRRGIAAGVATLLVAAAVPLLSTPASAAGGYTLTGPSTVNVGAAATFALTNGSLGPTGLPDDSYCLVPSPGAAGAMTATVAVVGGDTPTTSLPLTATLEAQGFYRLNAVRANNLLGWTCPADTSTVKTADILASINVTANDNAVSLAIVPPSAFDSVGHATAYTVTAYDADGLPTALGPDQKIVASQPSGTGITFDGASKTSVTFTSASAFPYTFTVQSATAQTATVQAQLINGALVAQTVTSSFTATPNARLLVTPTTANTLVGGSTAFKVQYLSNGGVGNLGVRVYASDAGRNAFANTQIGITDGLGIVNYTLKDTANPASSVYTDTVTFTANGLTATAVVTYIKGALTVTPSTATTASGGATAFTLTYLNGAGQPVNGVVVSASSAGRNAFGATPIGSTNAQGQLTYSFQDNNPTSATTTDTVTFTANGLTTTATVTYTAAASVTVTSPSNGSPISSGGYFNVWFTTTGSVPPGTNAWLLLNGRAKARIALGTNAPPMFPKIPAEVGSYTVRLGGGEAEVPVYATSAPFALNVITFGLNGRNGSSFSVLPGNFSAGTTVYLTRNSATVASARIPAKGQPFTITATPSEGVYQVWVASNQGRVYGDNSRVIRIGG